MSLDPGVKQCHLLDEVNVFPVCPQGKWTEYAMGAVAEYVESEDLQLEVRDSLFDVLLPISSDGRLAWLQAHDTNHSWSELNFS